jgi:hypothetical protein
MKTTTMKVLLCTDAVLSLAVSSSHKSVQLPKQLHHYSSTLEEIKHLARGAAAVKSVFSSQENRVILGSSGSDRSCDYAARRIAVGYAHRIAVGYAARRIAVGYAARRIAVGYAARRIAVGYAARRIAVGYAARRIARCS